MCGIAGLHLRNPALYPRLGELLASMLQPAAGRGNDSAGVGLYADPLSIRADQATVCLLGPEPSASAAARLVRAAEPTLEDV
ncbi:MAG: hypothetical protein LBG11_00065, partial [Bifidobacteriaceae bacterium]|nr:hypothetical protein [Bifidobacteriaceae bacterium]